jgi:putative ABC transport system permease protein
MLTSGRSWTGAILLLCVITLAAGFYPAFFLSKVRPIAAVRAGQARAPSRWVSSVLVGTQFASASFLLIAVLVMSAHNTHMKHMALGDQSEVLVALKNNVGVSQVNMDSLRTELLRQPNVKAVTSYHVVPWGYATGILRIARSAEDTGRARLSATNLVEHDFFSTLNMKLLAGRIFDREHATDVTLWKAQSPASVVIDRALAEQQGWIDPQQAIGKTLYLRGAALNRGVLPRPLNIIGVVEGKALGVLGLGATSNVYFLASASAAYPIIKISASDVAATLASIDSTWARLAPNVAVDRKLSGELLDSTYAIFERVTRAITALSLLAVLSALFGLIGMSIHIVGRRTHEIGVRKTLGASVGRITWLLLKDFSKPVIIANVIAWPLAFVAMRLYLSIFVDHAALSFVPFVSSIVVTLLIAWLAVAAQTIRAARVKPAAVLRYE